MTAVVVDQVRQPFKDLLEFTKTFSPAILPVVQRVIETAVNIIKAYKETPWDPLIQVACLYDESELQRICRVAYMVLTVFFRDKSQAARIHYFHGVIDEFAPFGRDFRKTEFLPEVAFFERKIQEKDSFEGLYT